MIIKLHDRKVLFVHINRTAGTTVENLFGTPSWDHRTLKEYLRDYDDLSGIYKFSIVRNPWDKEISDYFHHKRMKNSNFSIHEYFAQSEFTPGDPDFKYHSNQMEWLTDATGTMKMDNIIRFESFESDLLYVLNILGVKFTNIPKLNSTMHDNYRSYYTDELRKFVYDLYEKDINYFNYEF
jgi:hypothetical protein